MNEEDDYTEDEDISINPHPDVVVFGNGLMAPWDFGPDVLIGKHAWGGNRRNMNS